MTAKYDRIGIDYNATRRADPYLLSRLLFHLQPVPGATCLDIGCGTGNYTVELARSGARFIGVDPSREMLDKAQNRPLEAGIEIDWRQGHAESIPVADQAVAGVVASFTLHHWSDLNLAFRELSRVMQPGARLVMLTATPEQMQGYWLYHYFPVMLRESAALMPDLPTLRAAMQQAGLDMRGTEKYFVHPELTDGFLYSGKHDPQRYLDPRLRQGISSFSDVARATEVASGLKALENDIQSGKIKEVIRSYENDGGDYLYVTARKPETP